MRVFSPDQVRRYHRHLILPKVGGAGQRKLLEAKVLIVGTGGLGSPAALYLAAAGVGTLGLVDFDSVDASNLQRQVLYSTDDIGKSKVERAAARIFALNSDVQAIPHEEYLTSENAFRIMGSYDIILDGTDNFATRYLINDAAVMLKKTVVHGSIYQFDGQITVFKPGEGPCYRCLFPKPPPPGSVPNCAEAGVLGVLPGVVGTIQATETVKLILGIGRSLVGRLMIYDALEMEFSEVSIGRDPNCPVCCDNPTITDLIDYDQFCNTSPVTGLGQK